jgi:hypothetical protein
MFYRRKEEHGRKLRRSSFQKTETDSQAWLIDIQRRETDSQAWLIDIQGRKRVIN